MHARDPSRAGHPRGEDSRPPIRAPASALRRARPPPSDGGRAPHTALRAPPWAFTQHIVSTNVLSSPRGIGILAQSPRRDQRGRRATHASDPPTHTSHSQGTNAARLQSRQSQSSNSSSLSESQQPLRLRAGGWATNGRLQSTHLRTHGAPTTRRAGADRALPSAGPPRSDARHTRRSDPESTAGAGAAAAIPHLTMHACARPVPRRPPPGGRLTPPHQGPRIRAETSATSAERRRTRPSHRATRAPVGVHTTHRQH